MFAPHSLRYSLASRPLRVSLLCRLQTAIALHRQRRALARLDAAALADIGLTRAEALHSFTLAAAYAARQEDRLGSLEPGKWADFIIIDRNYFTVPASEIDDIVVLETWVAGEKVFDREESTP